MASDSSVTALPIVPYPSFAAALDHFHEAGGTPSELHASVFPKNKFSGTTIALLVRAFKQLGMADENGNTFHEKIDPLINPDTRKQALQALLERSYGSLIKSVATASPNQFNKWFDEYHMNGEDTRKAKTFFLHAARANDVPVSAFITNKYKTRSRAAGKVTPNKGAASKCTAPKPPGSKGKGTDPGSLGGESRLVKLDDSDAQMTIAVSKSLMQLSRVDRELVLAVLDKIEAYEKGEPE
jgi:hypothetical protein